MAKARISAGLLLFRRRAGGIEVLLAHLGGPFFANKDAKAWGVPKGEVEEADGELLRAAVREFTEEMGHAPPSPEQATYWPLGSVTQKSGKTVHAWAVEGDFDPKALRSNTFEIEWPRGSGVMKTFAEVDRVEWCSPQVAQRKMLEAQAPFIQRLVEQLNVVPPEA